jgi:hypothetical protein
MPINTTYSNSYAADSAITRVQALVLSKVTGKDECLIATITV